MNILFDIAHPADVHLFRHARTTLIANGHKVVFMARDKDVVIQLLDAYGIPYEKGTKAQKGLMPLSCELLKWFFNAFFIIRKYNMDLAVSLSSPSTAWAAKLQGVPHIMFNDTETGVAQLRMARPATKWIYTPECLLADWGPKQIRYKGIHDLAYLGLQVRGRRTEDGDQKSEVRDRKSEGGGQRSEDGSQRSDGCSSCVSLEAFKVGATVSVAESEVGGRRSEDGDQKSEIRSQKSEIRSQKSEIRSQKSEIRSQKSEVRDQKSKVRDQKSEVRDQKSEVRDRKLEGGGHGPEDGSRESETFQRVPTTTALQSASPFHGLTDSPDYAIIRFVSWGASHDRGMQKTSVKFQKRIFELISSKMSVYISAEGELPEELERYRLTISPDKLHDVMAFAKLVVGDGATTATEAAVMGVPSIYVSPFAHSLGYCAFLEEYGLLTAVDDESECLEHIQKLLNEPEFEERTLRREKLLADSVDVTAFIVERCEAEG